MLAVSDRTEQYHEQNKNLKQVFRFHGHILLWYEYNKIAGEQNSDFYLIKHTDIILLSHPKKAKVKTVA